MTERWDSFKSLRGAQGGRGASDHSDCCQANRSSTVPLLCCRHGFEVEGTDEVEGGVRQAQAKQRRTQFEHVAVTPIASVGAPIRVQAEVDAEGTAAAIAAMDPTGTAF